MKSHLNFFRQYRKPKPSRDFTYSYAIFYYSEECVITSLEYKQDNHKSFDSDIYRHFNYQLLEDDSGIDHHFSHQLLEDDPEISTAQSSEILSST